MSEWTAADIPDQTGRVFVVTGANSGIGQETARQLANRKAHVVLACRNTAKGETARREIGGSTEVKRLDLMDLESVRAFAVELADWKIDVLINNAGIMNVPLERTAQGIESQLGTNVVGHFLLSQLLLPRLTDRVVWLSSLMHRIGRINLEDPGWEHHRYNGWLAYGQSKLADLMLAYEMQRRFVASGSHLRSIAAHPGHARTNLQTRSGTWQDVVFGAINQLPLVAQSAEMGALPSLYAATVPDLAGGSFIGPRGRGEAHGTPRPVGSSAASHDLDVAKALWEWCEKVTGRG